MLTEKEAIAALKRWKSTDDLEALVAECEWDAMSSQPAFALQCISLVPEIFPYFEIHGESFLNQAIALSPWVAHYVEEAAKPIFDKCDDLIVLSGLIEEANEDRSVCKTPEWKRQFLDLLAVVSQEKARFPYEKTELFQILWNDFPLNRFDRSDNEPYFDDPKFVQDVFNATGFFFLPALCGNSLDEEDELVEILIQATDGLAFGYLPKAYREDGEYVKGWLRFFPAAFRFLAPEQRNDLSFASLAIAAAPQNFVFVGQDIRSSKEAVMELAKENPMIFFHLPESFRKDPDIAIAIIEEDPLMYRFLDEALQEDETVRAAFEKRAALGMHRVRILIDPAPKPDFRRGR